MKTKHPLAAAAVALGSDGSGRSRAPGRPEEGTRRQRSLPPPRHGQGRRLRPAHRRPGRRLHRQPGRGGHGHPLRQERARGRLRRGAASPEALVYEPRRNGHLRLVALEYVVLQDAWDAAHASPPELFGREFELIPAGNRYGLPPFYELHAWLWKFNPRGLFDDWNPRVSCQPRCRHGR